MLLARKEKMLAERKQAKLSGNHSKTNSSDEEIFGMKKRMPFLDLLLTRHLDDGSLSLNDVREEVDFFMAAGHETVSSAMMWAVFLLGHHPKAQAKVHAELDQIFGEDQTRPVTREDVGKMRYIEWAANESMRVYPSIPLVSRTLTQAITVQGYTVPEGCQVGISMYLTHRDPRYWPNPEQFIPERFSPENSAGRHPYAFIPFAGSSPRNCPGMKFAYVEMKTILALLFRKFKVTSLTPRDQVRVTPLISLKSKNPLEVKLELR